MPRQGVTREEVFEVAHKLHLSRDKVTAARIRAHIGSGSISTIHKHLKKWLAEKPGHDVDTNKNSSTIPYIYIESLKTKITEHQLTIEKILESNEKLINEVRDKHLICDEAKSSNIKIKKEYLNLVKKNTWLEEKVTEYDHKFKILLDQHSSHMAQIISSYDARIEHLMTEVKDILISSRNEVRDISSKHSDKIMEQKTKVILLQDKLSQKEKLIERVQLKLSGSSVAKKIESLELENARLLNAIAERN